MAVAGQHRHPDRVVDPQVLQPKITTAQGEDVVRAAGDVEMPGGSVTGPDPVREAESADRVASSRAARHAAPDLAELIGIRADRQRCHAIQQSGGEVPAVSRIAPHAVEVGGPGEHVDHDLVAAGVDRDDLTRRGGTRRVVQDQVLQGQGPAVGERELGRRRGVVLELQRAQQPRGRPAVGAGASAQGEAGRGGDRQAGAEVEITAQLIGAGVEPDRRRAAAGAGGGDRPPDGRGVVPPVVRHRPEVADV